MIFRKLEFNMEIIFFDYLVFLMVTTLLFLTTLLLKKLRKYHIKKSKLPSKEKKIILQKGG
jgi:hypothetical protein